MGVTEDDVRKAVEEPGKGVELRAGARTQHQAKTDNISKLQLPIPFHQELGDNDGNEECVKFAAACGLFHYDEDVANELKLMSTHETEQGRKTRGGLPH